MAMANSDIFDSRQGDSLMENSSHCRCCRRTDTSNYFAINRDDNKPREYYLALKDFQLDRILCIRVRWTRHEWNPRKDFQHQISLNEAQLLLMNEFPSNTMHCRSDSSSQTLHLHAPHRWFVLEVAIRSFRMLCWQHGMMLTNAKLFWYDLCWVPHVSEVSWISSILSLP